MKCDDTFVLDLIGAQLGEIRSDPEFTAKTSKGIGLRYAEMVLAEVVEQAQDARSYKGRESHA
jgi:hypothetical protein